jgi:hypothetical protein
MNSLQNNIHDSVLIIFYNVSAPDAIHVLKSSHFKSYVVKNALQEDIIRGHYSNIKENDLEFLLGKPIECEETEIIINDTRTIKQQALKIVENLI